MNYKKIFQTSLLFLFILVFSACSSKWHPENYYLSEEDKLEAEQAIATLKDKLEEAPNDENLLFELGFNYDHLGKYKKAISYYEKVLEINETNWVTLNNLAAIYEEVGEYDLAAEYIKKLYSSNQTGIEAIKDTVRILLKAGDAENATLALENFTRLNLDPENPNPEMQTLISDLYDDIYTWKQENETQDAQNL